MNTFAALLDALACEPSRNGKLRLMARYFRDAADPDRGFGLAALTGGLSFAHAKPAAIRALIADRTDPELFALSYDYVGDLSETVALMWPARRDGAESAGDPPSLTEIVERFEQATRAQVPRILETLLDALDETGRWALLKLITGGLRVGASARLARVALAQIATTPIAPGEIEEVWPSLKPPYGDLFAWLEGRAERPEISDPAPFRPPMLAHPILEDELEALEPAAFAAEWKWDGIRIQASAGENPDGRRVARLYSRIGEDISTAFPDALEMLLDPRFGETSIGGELLVMREGRTGSFSDLQQRLNRKKPDVKTMRALPAQIRAYDILRSNGEDVRALTFSQRRELLEAFAATAQLPALDVSPLIIFSNWRELAQARAAPDSAGLAGEPVEGVMIKQIASPYLPGRPKGHWFKWKRDPFNVDAVLMYAQRGHGKRSSLYSDYTFGVWREGPEGLHLTPVGKAYSGFTDEELKRLDRYVRENTVNRFGPVREVTHSRTQGLVLEIAFEGLQRSVRHKSGLAMRFPRVARIRWDKPAHEAGIIEELEALLAQLEAGA